ncbi:DUF4037 domain-containing protein [Kribbella sp. VKM Ac-2571]|uniref:DUF4037 domain-containing protein n=1 Tax=Kribbella sp. VKM Ac-2571 TaxID=2512222 RepID=UPI00192D781D|nr:DUF4037 domain-containing protein [Kribbella sp. VKM Ac-2571]
MSRRFYEEAVRPILDADFAGLRHSAALIGRGSEVLGFDDEMSTDHNCEARVVLFLGEADHETHGAAVGEALSNHLPSTFADRPTAHELYTLRDYVRRNLDFDVERDIEVDDWITFAEQRLLMLTAGEVYHDEVGLEALRRRFAYYPHDLWLYLLLAGWWRIHPEANLVGRTGSVGDELGSSVIGSGIVLDVMRLCFLMERQYAPYSKWLGTAFSRLTCGPQLAPLLLEVQRATTWQDRENALLPVYEKLSEMHNALSVTDPVATGIVQMWDRPFKVLWGDFPAALRDRIEDPAVKELAGQWPVGGADKFREMMTPPSYRSRLRRVFE